MYVCIDDGFRIVEGPGGVSGLLKLPSRPSILGLPSAGSRSLNDPGFRFSFPKIVVKS